MNTVIIQSKNKKETDLILEVAKRMKLRGRYLSEDEFEEQWLARMIKQSEDEGGEVMREKVIRLLKKNGVSI